ncbi:MAG: TPR end-of-group domain-containing protein [Bacteroidia bacterium]
MKTVPELLHLYEDFFTKLGAKINTNPNDPAVRSEDYVNPADAEIDAFEKQFKIYVPADIREFWKSIGKVYSAFDDDDTTGWSAGWDFMSLKEYLIRDTPKLRELAKAYEDGDPIKKLHETGVQLTSEEPILLFNTDSKTKQGNIHWICYDGSPLADAITSDFRTFLEHWLAAGCFHHGNKEAYLEIVKDIVPVRIPVKDNLWIQYYDKIYNSGPTEEEQKAKDALGAEVEAAYGEVNEGIALWRNGEEKEAIALFKKAFDTARRGKEDYLANRAIETWANLCGESDRPQESIKILRDYLNTDTYAGKTDASAWALLGQYHYETGKLKEGLELCNHAITVDPALPIAYYSRACAHVRLKNYKEALADIIKTTQLHSPFKEQIGADNDFVPLRDMSEFKKAIS